MTTRTSKVKELEELVRIHHNQKDDCLTIFIDMSTIADKLHRNMYELDEMEMCALLNALKCMAHKGIDVSSQ